MKKAMQHVTTYAAMVCLTIMLTACGKSSVENIPDRPAMDQAIAQYLTSKSMDLKIAEYTKFTLANDGKHAEAEIKMQYAGEGIAGVKAIFKFSLEKKENEWQVVTHSQK